MAIERAIEEPLLVTVPSSEFQGRKQIGIEIQTQLRLALPMIGVNLVQFVVQLSSLMFVGHLGELQLSAASIATSFCMVSGFSLLLGLASALETFCGQAYGAESFPKLGIYLQRAVIVLTAVSVPLSVVWFNMEHVLLLFRQSPLISKYAGIYARCLIPGLFAYAFLQPLVKFLQVQGAVHSMFITSTLATVVHVVLCYTGIFKLRLGFTIAAWSTSFCYWLNVLGLVCIVAFTPRCKRCWSGLSTDMFREILPFLMLAIPSAIMICLEYWAFELLTLLAGVLTNPQLETSVFATLINTGAVCYMFPYGISAAASTRVSNELGAGNPSAARFSFMVAIGLATVDALVVSTSVLLCRNVLGKAFSNEKEVICYLSRRAPFLALITVMDAYGGILSGVLRGCGSQAAAAFANLGAFYFIGFPIGYTLGFVLGLGGKGLLIGIVSGVSAQACFLLGFTMRTNWSKQAERAIATVLGTNSVTQTTKSNELTN